MYLLLMLLPPPGDKGDISYPTSEPVEGPTGEKGSKGDDGDVGPVGNTGQPGPRGTPGPRGELNCLGMCIFIRSLTMYVC